MEYIIKLDNNNWSINDHIIDENIFAKDLHEYKIISRETMVDDLIDWISEAKGSDKILMKEDLKYLIGQKDEFIFSSISTNEYVLKSVNLNEFNKIAEELLDLTLKLQTITN